MKLSSVLVAAAMTLAGCQMLSDKSVPAVPPAVAVQVTSEQIEAREAQAGLKKLGYYRSRVDGIAGPRTSAAVQRSQADFGLEPTGEIDSEFLDVMNRYLELNPPRKGIPLAADVFAAQRGLKRLGYYSGRVNGFYDRATLASVINYRRKYGLPVTEQIDAKLLRRIESDTMLAADG